LGQGGISSAEDAIEFLLAGATTVGVGTALFFDPLICDKINKGISNYLETNNYTSVNSLVGDLAKQQ
jgi:dihydroorotate dehydrogenase (NAD+) catalytic subunit